MLGDSVVAVCGIQGAFRRLMMLSNRRLQGEHGGSDLRGRGVS